jgi:hypothetical protein
VAFDSDGDDDNDDDVGDGHHRLGAHYGAHHLEEERCIIFVEAADGSLIGKYAPEVIQ